MRLEMIPRQARDFARIGQDPDRAVAHRDGLGLAIALSAGFVIVIELRGWGKRAHADMYSNEHYRQVRIFGTMLAAREVFPSELIERFLRFGEVRRICLDSSEIKGWHANADQEKN
jgi:hypothetical protein